MDEQLSLFDLRRGTHPEAAETRDEPEPVHLEDEFPELDS